MTLNPGKKMWEKNDFFEKRKGFFLKKKHSRMKIAQAPVFVKIPKLTAI